MEANKVEFLSVPTMWSGRSVGDEVKKIGEVNALVIFFSNMYSRTFWSIEQNKTMSEISGFETTLKIFKDGRLLCNLVQQH